MSEENQSEGQTWCDHCSADLDSVRHILCERCYREYAGPKWFDPAFAGASDPTVTADHVNAAAEAIAKRYTVGKGGIAVIAAIITRHLAATPAGETEPVEPGSDFPYRCSICSARLDTDTEVCDACREPVAEKCLCGHPQWDHWNWGRNACAHCDCTRFAAATTSPEIDVEPRICLKCGHEERYSDNEGGICEKIVDEESNFCGCVCRFAAPVTRDEK